MGCPHRRLETGMVIAYRLGQLPDTERHKEQEQLPSGPRLCMREAAQVKLPDGTRFQEASSEQVEGWLTDLVKQADASPRLLASTLSGLDLARWEDRWFALNELLEMGSVRDVFEGKERAGTAHGGFSREALAALLAPCGLWVALSRKPDGTTHVFAQCNVPPRCRVYLGTLSALEAGKVSREAILQKIEKKGGERAA